MTPHDKLRALLETLAHEIATQDNAATSDPYYTVQQRVRDYGIESGYGEDGFIWVLDGDERDPDRWSKEHGQPFDPDDPPDGWLQVCYRDRWEHVQAFLTQSAALRFMAREAHNHGPLRTWVESACRNPQMRQLRELPTQALSLLDEIARLRALVQPPVVADPTEDTRPWCWRRPGSERCEGPFDTRDEAIHDARHGHAVAGPIEVGRCTPPMDALGTPDADDMRERVNNILCDEGLDAHAIIMDEPAADAALREWFLRYVQVDGMQWIARDEETVWPDATEEGGTP